MFRLPSVDPPAKIHLRSYTTYPDEPRLDIRWELIEIISNGSTHKKYTREGLYYSHVRELSDRLIEYLLTNDTISDILIGKMTIIEISNHFNESLDGFKLLQSIKRVNHYRKMYLRYNDLTTCIYDTGTVFGVTIYDKLKNLKFHMTDSTIWMTSFTVRYLNDVFANFEVDTFEYSTQTNQCDIKLREVPLTINSDTRKVWIGPLCVDIGNKPYAKNTRRDKLALARILKNAFIKYLPAILEAKREYIRCT